MHRVLPYVTTLVLVFAPIASITNQRIFTVMCPFNRVTALINRVATRTFPTTFYFLLATIWVTVEAFSSISQQGFAINFIAIAIRAKVAKCSYSGFILLIIMFQMALLLAPLLHIIAYSNLYSAYQYYQQLAPVM